MKLFPLTPIEKGFLAAVAVSAAIVAFAPKANSLTIYNDNGGVVLDYIKKSRQLIDSKEQIRILGTCASSCLLYLRTNNVCVSPKTKFIAHAVFGADPQTNTRLTRLVFDTYPSWMKKYINSHGGMTSRLITIPNSLIRRYYPTCN